MSTQQQLEQYREMKARIQIGENGVLKYPDEFDMDLYAELDEKFSDQVTDEVEKIKKETEKSLSKKAQKEGKDPKETSQKVPDGSGLKFNYKLSFAKSETDQAQAMHDTLRVLSDSPFGEIDLKDLILYIIDQGLSEEQIAKVRDFSFSRKLDQALSRYNRENKSQLSVNEFLATQISNYLN